MPYRDAKSWFSRVGSTANTTEMLFFAFLVVYNSTGAVQALKSWAKSVLEHEAAFRATGVIPVEWKPKGNVVPAVYSVICDAYKSVRGETELMAIADAIHKWDGPGKVDFLDVGRLRSHFRFSEGDNGKKKPPVRWKSPNVLFTVARLIKEQRGELGRLLVDETPREDLPSFHETAERVAELEGKLEETKAENERMFDAKRKQAELQLVVREPSRTPRCRHGFPPGGQLVYEWPSKGVVAQAMSACAHGTRHRGADVQRVYFVICCEMIFVSGLRCVSVHQRCSCIIR